MNKYGVVLDDFGMETMLDKLMVDFIRPISKGELAFRSQVCIHLSLLVLSLILISLLKNVLQFSFLGLGDQTLILIMVLSLNMGSIEMLTWVSDCIQVYF